MQKDLFGGAVAASIIPSSLESKTDFLQKYRFTIRLDQAIIGVLLLLVAYVLVFSFGVESGKRYAMSEIKAERAMRERMARELGEKIFANANLNTEKNTVQAVAGDSKALGLPAIKTATIPDTQNVGTKTGEIPEKIQTVTKSAGKFAIQTVTFTSKAAAEKQIKKLAAKGYQGFIIPKGKFQQVCVRGFETKNKALQAMGHLKNEGLAPKDAYIRTTA